MLSLVRVMPGAGKKGRKYRGRLGIIARRFPPWQESLRLTIKTAT